MALAGLAIASCGEAENDPLVPAGVRAASTTPTTAPPYAVAFQFRNDTAAPLSLLQSCGNYGFGISSCASGFSDQLNDFVACACSCDDPQCGITCGACADDEGTVIVGGDSLRRQWDGSSTTVAPSAFGQCVNSRALPAGRYRVSIWVYDSAAAALGRSGRRVVSRDFELPAPNGLVDVPLGPSPDDVCDDAPQTPLTACTGREARDVPCDLAAEISFSNLGGLAPSQDSETLTPPAIDRRTRSTFGTGAMVVACSTKIPRCARDARVTTTGDVVRALGAPGLASSFGPDAPAFGVDPRAADGSILVVARPNGTSVGIGSTCSQGCERPLTPALQALGSVLQRLSAQQLGDVGCAALAPPRQ